jgi:hypothetical protein
VNNYNNINLLLNKTLQVGLALNRDISYLTNQVKTGFYSCSGTV